jgi:signal transduction histidine kinase
MRIAPFPANEELRLQDLLSLNILDSDIESEFDELVELAASICNCPISLISLLDKDRQWFKSRIGIEAIQTPRDKAFCAHAILQDGLFVVEDALKDERFADMALDLDIRFYAGAPILSPNGHKVGTICVIDHKPNQLTKEQARALTILSHQVTILLELRTKNKIIQRQANEVIEFKSKMVDHVINEQEREKQFIAAELHENLAQSLAASLLYISMAEDSEEVRLPLLKKAKEHLGDILNDIRKLSDSITPSTILSMPLEFLIGDYIKDMNSDNAFNIEFNVAGEIEHTSNEHNIAFFRVLEKWLDLLRERGDVTKVRITLQVGFNTSLSIEDDGKPRRRGKTQREVVAGMIDNRIDRMGGLVTFLPLEENGNMLCVTLPFTREKSGSRDQELGIRN